MTMLRSTFLWLGLGLLLMATACDKESTNEYYQRVHPIPTELPDATCTGANTIGCYVDTVLFVANYFPNLSSWGAATYEDGVRAFIEKPEYGYINIIAQHPIRPHDIDTRSMRLALWYYPEYDSIRLLKFQYSNPGDVFSLDLDTFNVERPFEYQIQYDPVAERICGTIHSAPLIEYNPRYLGDPLFKDTITLRDLRFDLPVHMGRY